MSSKREEIFGVIDTMIMDLFYYDRKEDEEVGLWDIPRYLKDHPEDVKEIVEIFETSINREINSYKTRFENEDI